METTTITISLEATTAEVLALLTHLEQIKCTVEEQQEPQQQEPEPSWSDGVVELVEEIIDDDTPDWWVDVLCTKELPAWRAQHNLSQRRVAELVGVIQPTISAWERGAHRPKGHNALRLDALMSNHPESQEV